MLENGKRLNKHAKVMLGKNKQKQQCTPHQFSSYKTYIASSDSIPSYIRISQRRAIENGWVPYHRRWWQRRQSEYYRGDSIKRNVKQGAHSEERAYYRHQLSNYKKIEEYDVLIRKRFSDPWDWD